MIKERNHLLQQLYLSVVKRFPSSNGKVYAYRESILESLGIDRDSIKLIKAKLMEEKVINAKNSLKIDKNNLLDFDYVLFQLDSLGF